MQQGERSGRQPRYLVDIPLIPSDPEDRAVWFDALRQAIEIDLLAKSAAMRNEGLPPAEIERQLDQHRRWLMAFVGGIVDGYLAEVAWGAGA